MIVLIITNSFLIEFINSQIEQKSMVKTHLSSFINSLDAGIGDLNFHLRLLSTDFEVLDARVNSYTEYLKEVSIA